MVRLEKQGDSFVMITGSGEKPDISVLINAIAELMKSPPDNAKLREGLLYLDESSAAEVRKDIKAALQKALDKKGLTVTDL
ncbi:MAG: hypothetical protein J5U19_11900 [Candidatus Methanoperedens sp.]|nr:hypothetical protein [Candidatus Methanoperedens sp.]